MTLVLRDLAGFYGEKNFQTKKKKRKKIQRRIEKRLSRIFQGYPLNSSENLIRIYLKITKIQFLREKLCGISRLQFARSVHNGKNDYEIDALSTGPFAPPFARSLAPLNHSLAPHCLLCLRHSLRSFVRPLVRSLTPDRRSE